MALAPKSWRINTYTPDTYVDLIVSTSLPVIIKSLIISETAGVTPTVRARITNSAGIEQTAIVVGEVIEASKTYSLDFPVLVLSAGEKLQVSSSLAGTNFTAAGVQ